ncbi:ABC transporter ATP-binding protein [Luteibacter sp. dw_328]|uniref:ATP-binding cassette domain-containing protein n=1 Tax=Luteibacter sp. dw_328 TaxID=2719796 RepID=UPI001BD586B6|nr:ABC transporter ATP-binding protein [Luteibacter sp. dw_328]
MNVATPRAGLRDLLRSLARTLPLADRWKVGIYVALSLGSAFAGALAAVLLVPLVQPDARLPFDGRWFHASMSVGWRIAAFTAVTLSFALLRWQAACLGARLTGRYGMRLRRQVHARLIAAEIGPLAGVSSAEIANVFTHNVEIIVQAFSALQQLLVAGITAAVSLSLAFWVSPLLLLVAPPLAVLALLASRFYGREQVEVARRYVADITRLFWHSEDFPRRLRHVRSFGREHTERDSFGEVSEDLSRGYARQLELIASGRLMLELLAVGGIALLFVVAQRWHGIDQGALIAVCLLLGRLLPYLVSTRQSMQQMRSAAPAFALWRRYMNLAASDTPPASTALPAIPASGIHLRRIHVTPPVPGIELVDLVMRPGELVLIQGDSGIGKSSLVDVLAGMARPAIFDVRVDGHAIHYDAYRAYVSHGAYVSQSVRPWQATVRECLRWAAASATDGQLREVLREVGLDKPLDTTLHDVSSRLSGGELQRLLLAQVILREPAVAVLDEATGALDAASELAVLSAMKRRLSRSLLIVVSHREGVSVLADRCVTVGPTFRSIVPSRAGA